MLENRMGDSIYLLLLLILQIKDFFLCLDFCTQFFFRGQVQLTMKGHCLVKSHWQAGCHTRHDGYG